MSNEHLHLAAFYVHGRSIACILLALLTYRMRVCSSDAPPRRTAYIIHAKCMHYARIIHALYILYTYISHTDSIPSTYGLVVYTRFLMKQRACISHTDVE